MKITALLYISEFHSPISRTALFELQFCLSVGYFCLINFKAGLEVRAYFGQSALFTFATFQTFEKWGNMRKKCIVYCQREKERE